MLRVVRKLFYGLMFTLLALMSAGASAHAGHAAHGRVHSADGKVAYAHQSATQEKQSHTLVYGVASKAETSHVDTCDHSHCGHAQVAGLLARDGSDWNIDTASNAPTQHTSWATSHVTNNIERPKWPVTTPAVVSLLS